MEDISMKKRLFWCLTASLVLLTSASSLVLAKSAVSENGGYTEADKEFYMTESELAFIRPGLEVDVLDVVIPADRQPEVTMMVTDPGGLPLDIDGVFTPGSIRMLMTLAYIPVGEEVYIAYTTRVASSDITGESAVQASYDSGGVYTQMAPGKYMYKFATVLPEDYEMDATTSLGVQARRTLTDFELGEYVDNELYHFIPSGNGVPVPRDITTTATCNRCHDPLSLHGGWRYEMGVCVLCHNQTQSIDPDTMDSVDMPYMVHKIHMGDQLVNGYTIIGYGGSVHDYSHVEYPASREDCGVCHTGGTPTDDFPLVATPNPAPVCDGKGVSTTNISWGDQGHVKILVGETAKNLFGTSSGAGSKMSGHWNTDGLAWFLEEFDSGEELQRLDVYNTVFGCANNAPSTPRGEAGVQHTAWMTNPTRMNCGSCHDDIDFAEGIGHPAQADDSSCAFCHKPTGDEFGFSVAGAHTEVYKSAQQPGFLVDILSVEDTGPGQSPLVTFSMKTKFGQVDPATINRLRFSLSGPNDDFNFYVQENAPDTMVQSGANWTFRFAAALPDDAEGSFSLGVEGRTVGPIDQGGEEPESERDVMTNFIYPFAVTDTAVMSRREVVSDEKCESCHSHLSLHGGGRNDGGAYCQTCHQVWATDVDEAPEGATPQSIDFRYMIHKIHRGEDLVRGYDVYGHNGSFHPYGDKEYPGDLRNCDACHENDSYQLPLPVGTLPVTTPQDFWSPMMPETASCLSCHDSSAAAAHADLNTSDFGESCSVCHGVSSTFSVDKVHAR
jgi:hypothetical protein